MDFMKRFALWMCCLALALSPPLVAQEAAAGSTPSEPSKRQVIERMQKLKLDRVEFREQTLAQCLDWLKTHGMPLTLDSKLEKKDLECKMTLTLENVPALEALKYVTNLSNTKFLVREGKFVVKSFGQPGAVLTKEWKVPRSFFGILRGEKDSAMTKDALDEFFSGSGINFADASVSVSYDGGTQTLRAKHAESVIDQIDDMVIDFHEGVER
jgi:hypothetical protein